MTTRLFSPWGWVYAYTPQGDGVRLVSSYRAESTREQLLGLAEAREHYRATRRRLRAVWASWRGGETEI